MHEFLEFLEGPGSTFAFTAAICFSTSQNSLLNSRLCGALRQALDTGAESSKTATAATAACCVARCALALWRSAASKRYEDYEVKLLSQFQQNAALGHAASQPAQCPASTCPFSASMCSRTSWRKQCIELQKITIHMNSRAKS